MMARRRKKFKVIPIVLAALLLGGCMTVGPDYAEPESKAPAAWRAKLPDGLTSGTADAATLAAWWRGFDDPTLAGLIGEAVAGNLDLKTAASRVREARAQLAISRADLFPTADASGSITHGHTRTESKVAGQTQVTRNESSIYRAGFDASWEVDVFGGTRRQVEASGRDLEAQQADFHDVLVSLVAEVAGEYVNVRAYQTRLDLAEANLKMQKETLDLVESRFKAELINELPVQQARYTYENTAAQIPTLRTGLEESLNRLAILLGENPGALHARLATHQPIPVAPDRLAVGVPSEALRRRPDIRRAEMQLAAQTARVGVAVADLYPKFYLTGAASRQGDGSAGFRELATSAYSFGPSVSWNIFDAGALRQQVKVQNEIEEQYLLGYRSAVLDALEEVENKLYSIGQKRERRGRLANAVAAARSALELAKAQYSVGQVDFTDVISAEQSLLVYEDTLAQSDGQIATDTISLFKAIGGGWTPADANERTAQK